MKTTSCWRATLQATLLGLLFSRTLAQTSTTELGPITTLACYNDAGTLVKDNTNTFQTSGICQQVCGNKNHAVMAIIGGSTCYCGDILPPADAQVDQSKCNSPCQGFGSQMCGGIGFYQFYLTGLTGDVQTLPNSTSSSSSAGTHASTRPAQTVVVTQSASATPSASSGGPSKVGIAVGVVVAVIAIATMAGGAIFYMRQKRKREILEEHKAQAAINSFVGHNSDTKSDMRLDPSVASSFRRDSVGSIRDEVDYTRKILQVRNPDRGSMTSVA